MILSCRLCLKINLFNWDHAMSMHMGHYSRLYIYMYKGAYMLNCMQCIAVQTVAMSNLTGICPITNAPILLHFKC